jgi:hypothetical protein
MSGAAYRFVYSDMYGPLYDVTAVREGRSARLEWSERFDWSRAARMLTDLEWDELSSCWDWDSSFWSMIGDAPSGDPAKALLMDATALGIEAAKDGRWHAVDIEAPRDWGPEGRLVTCGGKMLGAAGLMPAWTFRQSTTNCGAHPAHGDLGEGDAPPYTYLAGSDPASESDDLACAGEPSLLRWTEERPDVVAFRVVVAVPAGLHVIARVVWARGMARIYATVAAGADEVPLTLSRPLTEREWMPIAACWAGAESRPGAWKSSAQRGEPVRTPHLVMVAEAVHGGHYRAVSQAGDRAQLDATLVDCAEGMLRTADIRIAALSRPPLVDCPDGSQWDGGEPACVSTDGTKRDPGISVRPLSRVLPRGREPEATPRDAAPSPSCPRRSRRAPRDPRRESPRTREPAARAANRGGARARWNAP